MDDEALEAASYPAPQEAPAENVDWAKVEQSGRGMTLKLLGGGMARLWRCMKFAMSSRSAERPEASACYSASSFDLMYQRE